LENEAAGLWAVFWFLSTKRLALALVVGIDHSRQGESFFFTPDRSDVFIVEFLKEASKSEI
jgi:hypothetical protein